MYDPDHAEDSGVGCGLGILDGPVDVGGSRFKMAEVNFKTCDIDMQLSKVFGVRPQGRESQCASVGVS